MAKKGNGEGTIYYSEKLGRWVGQFVAGRKDDGRLNRKSVYGKTRKEVKEKMTKALSDIQNHSFIDRSDVTLLEIATLINDNKRNANIITETTYNRNQKTLTVISKSFEDVPIQKITSFMLQSFLNSLIHKYSNSYIEKISMQINQSYKYAISHDIIYKNPMIDVIKPKAERKDKKVEALSIEEQQAFLNFVKGETYENIFMIALYTGMRIGEILSLTPADIDLDKNIIHISKSLTEDSNQKKIVGKNTKTPHSIRDIPIIDILKPYILNSLDSHKDNSNNLLFTLPNGKIITPSTINTHFKRICKNAGVKCSIYLRNKNGKMINCNTSSVNTHMLRHTYATRCIESGMNAVVLQKLLGHKSIEITLNTYTSVFNQFKSDELKKAEDYFKKINISI